MLARLWSHGPADVKGMHRAVGETRGITPNTVQSTLERLHRKGLAVRSKQGRAYRYVACVSRREWVARALQDLMSSLPDADGTAPDLLLSGFVDLAERAGEDQLEALERRLRARRRRGRRSSP